VAVTGFAVLLAAIYLAAAPHTADLAAQTARADLFRRSGYVAYWSGWYAGVPTAGYSLVTPPLLGWLGPVWLGALSIVATSVVAVPLLRGARRPALGAAAVAVVAMLDVVSGRTTFAVGVAIALAAALAAERRRPLLAGVLAAVATVASPVAGVLLAVVAAGTLVAGPRRWWAALWELIGVGVALAVIAVLSRGAPSGYEPLTRTSLLISVLTTFVVVVSPVGRRLRMIGWLTLCLLLVCYWVHSPVGANATRIAVLGALPAVVAAARWPRLVLPLAVVAAGFLPFSQLSNDLTASGGVQATKGFVAGLKAEIAAAPAVRQHRVEIVDPSTHWPSTYLLPTVSLARGWERQTDEALNPLFYGRAPLDAATYRAFLDRNAVGLVAVPAGVRLDFGYRSEAALVRAGLPYLHEVWSDAHWRLYAVADPAPLAAAPATVVRQTDTGLVLSVPSPGRYDVRLRWSPELAVTGGSVQRDPDGQVAVVLSSGGVHRIHAQWRWP
jgi:MFS family permease